jgi:hypothetical protein
VSTQRLPYEFGRPRDRPGNEEPAIDAAAGAAAPGQPRWAIRAIEVIEVNVRSISGSVPVASERERGLGVTKLRVSTTRQFLQVVKTNYLVRLCSPPSIGA